MYKLYQLKPKQSANSNFYNYTRVSQQITFVLHENDLKSCT